MGIADAATSGWGAMSPSTLARDDGYIGGVEVKNTFINVSDGSSARRHRHASRRARSVPANFRSNRNKWENRCHELGFRTERVTVSEPAVSTSSTPTTYPSTPEAEYCVPQPLPLMMPCLPQVMLYQTMLVVEPVRQVVSLAACV